MKKETANRIRFVLEDVIPPVIKDTRVFSMLLDKASGGLVGRLADFRKHAPFLSEAEYKALYESVPRLIDDTENTPRCLEQIRRDMLPGRICDVGCGTGYTLNFLRNQPKLGNSEFFGVDIVLGDQVRSALPFAQLREARIESLPFPDRYFDTVLCTHVLEHILDIRRAIAELRRVCARRLILIVPIERETLSTFNAHLHFFPYPHSFLRAMIPVPGAYRCFAIRRDIYYCEDRD